MLFWKTPKNALDEFEIDLEKSPTDKPSFWKRVRARLPSSVPALQSALLTLFLLGTIILLPNAASAITGYFYVFASMNPMSSASFAIHATRASWLAYQIFLPFISVVASLINLVFLLALVESIVHSFWLVTFSILVSFTPVWCPYIVEVALRKEGWQHSCVDFDGAILLAGTSSGASMSTAYFPPSLGGTTMQLYQSTQGLWEFSHSGNGTSVSYDFRNGTYGLGGVKSESGPFHDSPLSFPELNLTSQGQWIGSCFPPGVTLKDARGDIVVQTGLGAYGDCKKMKVCARTTLGVDAVVIAVGRILIALQGAASCCGQSRYG